MLLRRAVLAASLVLCLAPGTAAAGPPLARVVPGVGPIVTVPAPPAAAAPAVTVRHPVAPRRHVPRPTPRALRIDHLPFGDAAAARFLPLYRRAAATFGVSWRLLASIHQQETAFSSAHGTYGGLNFAGCCGGPMQFNVTNGPVTTWDRFRDAYRRADRPERYPHRTRRHPSIYDDFDAIMAAGALLRASGAGERLDGTTWLASYHYYGHDLTGLAYADRVLARAVGWARGGALCAECPVDEGLVASFDDAFARPYRAQILAAQRLARKRARAAARARAHGRRAHERAVAAAKRRAARKARAEAEARADAKATAKADAKAKAKAAEQAKAEAAEKAKAKAAQKAKAGAAKPAPAPPAPAAAPPPATTPPPPPAATAPAAAPPPAAPAPAPAPAGQAAS
jgi:hypothetical protein